MSRCGSRKPNESARWPRRRLSRSGGGGCSHALAASILAFTALGGLSTTYFLQQRAEQARLRVVQAAAVDRVVGEAVTLRDQAKGKPEDIASWQVALAAVKQAQAAGDEAAAPGLLALPDEIQTGLDAAQHDQTLLDRLVDIRSAEGDDQDGSNADIAYADAFGAAGIDVDSLSPAEAGAQDQGSTTFGRGGARRVLSTTGRWSAATSRENAADARRA